jgi:peptide/nickel transport system substrate-binding protein/microcin C transport system substrate-binding protein
MRCWAPPHRARVNARITRGMREFSSIRSVLNLPFPLPMRSLHRLACRVLGALALTTQAWAAPTAANGPRDDLPPPVTPAGSASAPAWAHGYAAFGEPKYPRGFPHFGYVNADAPKGGTINLRNPDRRSSFDKFNPFTVKGNAPAGLSIFMFEGLTVLSGDELQTMYGLLAEEISVAPDKSSISFRLNPKARFSNGDPVTAADVKYSFESMSGKYASPGLQASLAGVARLVVVDDRTVRFELKDRTTDMLFTVGGLTVFSRKWALTPDGEPKRFDQIVTEYPITSGPYTISKADSGRRLELGRNPDYWAADRGVRRGMFNWDRVVYRYYSDQAVAREAFKAGEFDIFTEYSARSWARQHKGPKWDDGRIVKEAFSTAVGQGLQAYMLNLRRPIFQDIRVRQALDYTYDFDTINRLGQYKRTESQFNNSEFAARGLPAAGELKLLEPFRDELPPEVFGPPYRAPSTGRDPKRLRQNLLKARELLAEAGWKLAADGKLRNDKGEAFEVEYLNPGEGGRVSDWQANLEKLGITLKERNVDFALYRRRLEEYDFDVIGIAGGDFTLPDATGLESAFGSKSADEKGNNNFRGAKSPAADHLIKVMAAARTLEELRNASRALDRVIMWNHWQVPDLYTSDQRASYWNRFGMPARRPLFFTIDTGTGFAAWPLESWWILDPAKR